MSTYRVAVGHNEALVDLEVLDPQPRSTGIQATSRTHAASGDIYDDAEYVILEYDFLETAAEYVGILTDFGLQTVKTAEVTVYVRDDIYGWVRKNGRAVRPDQGRDARWEKFFPRSIEILVRDLENPT